MSKTFAKVEKPSKIDSSNFNASDFNAGKEDTSFRSIFSSCQTYAKSFFYNFEEIVSATLRK